MPKNMVLLVLGLEKGCEIKEAAEKRSLRGQMSYSSIAREEAYVRNSFF